jgi:hypothetical protein
MSGQLPTTASETFGFFGATPVSQPTAAAQAAITDGSGGTAAPTTGVAAAAFKQTVCIDIPSMAALANAQTWKVPIPFAFTVTAANFRAGSPITTGAKAATLTTGIAGTPTTGGVIAVAGAYATGAAQAGSAITALNTGAAGDTLEFAVSAVTTFAEGSGVVEFTVTNNSLANAAATQIALENSMRSALVTLGLMKGS